MGHAARQVIVAVADFWNDLMVSLQADARRQSLIIPNAGRGKSAPQSLVLIPGCDGAASAIPRQGEISAAGHAGLQGNQGVENLEGRARGCADTVLDIMTLSQAGQTVFRGKTGSAFDAKRNVPKLGWFIWEEC